MRWFFVVLLCATHSAAHLAGVRVDRDTSTWRDAYNRTLLWRGTNFVQKEPPYYPVIADADITVMQQMGFNVARVGVMMPGLFPTGPTPNAAYLAATKAVVDRLWAAGVAVIIDLHQDVLSPQLCGEGSPPWMLNVSSLGSLAFPEPLEAHGVPADPATGSFPNKSCAAAGPLKFIGWSEFYMTDACGKAFEQMYGGDGTMAPGVAPLSYMFDTYWHVVAAFFRGHPGVLAYELLNEPWMGDVLTTPSLLLEAGAAEKLSVGPFMERMHGAVRQSDPDTPVLYRCVPPDPTQIRLRSNSAPAQIPLRSHSDPTQIPLRSRQIPLLPPDCDASLLHVHSPAELNNRLMRRVGYEEGFLPGEPMAFHVYCLTGTDGDGPTTPLAKELCHFNDGFQLTQRTDDLRRLRTAGIVTEFGAVSASATGPVGI